jgi:hypothetical protein
MTILTRKGEHAYYVPMSIDNDHHFLGSRYRNDPEFSAKLQQHMYNPSRELRTMSHNYETSHASQVEMVARLNQLQAHYVRSKRTGHIMKRKRMKDFNIYG